MEDGDQIKSASPRMAVIAAHGVVLAIDRGIAAGTFLFMSRGGFMGSLLLVGAVRL